MQRSMADCNKHPGENLLLQCDAMHFDENSRGLPALKKVFQIQTYDNSMTFDLHQKGLRSVHHASGDY